MTVPLRRSIIALLSLGLSACLPPVTAAAPAPATAAETDTATCLYELEVDTQTLCVRKAHFDTDLCQGIDHIAATHALPPAYFARLIWRESLFKPEAVSPKGAEGIAQFMPGTARLRGLANSFDVLAALDASAAYLDELRTKFGNLGLAAAAYNAGEGALSRFLSGGRLPIETRDYVFAITGHLVETWRDHPPTTAAPALADNTPFRSACVTLARTRQMKEPVLTGSADWAPWGVQLAAHYNPAVAERLFERSIGKLQSPLKDERALLVRQRRGNFGSRPRYAARIGRETRAQADKVCATIRAAGVACTVFRNR